MQTKQPLDPKDRVLNISRKKGAGSFIFLSKIFLSKFGSVELHGLGEATKIVAQVAETLRRREYVEIEKIETQTYEPEGEQKKRGGKKVKLIATLKVTGKGQGMIKEDLERNHENAEKQQ